MAPRKGTVILQLTENPRRKSLRWDYFDKRLQIGGLKRTDGAFRVFSIADLQQVPPVITLKEWTDLVPGGTRAEDPKNYPAYAAISHVWDPSDETAGTAKRARRPLKVKIKDKPGTQVISWHGLVEAANAADELGCKLLWLDFLCMDQIPHSQDDREKELQIYNMANIYRNAATVICMLGGVSAVQGLDSKTSWMDRAWTLQEATLNRNTTWAYVNWPSTYTDFVIHTATPKGCKVHFRPVKQEPGKYLIELLHLLEMPPLTDTTSTTPDLGLPKGFQVVCVDGKMNTGRARAAAKNAMLSIFRGKTPEMRLAGVWRAMLLRTSTKPVDIVYSVMGHFNVQVDPYREDRKVQYLFNDLARKAAAIGSRGMGWLVIGGVLGSVGRLNRDKSSLLIPRVPNYSRPQKPPRYWVGGKPVLSGNLVDDSRTAISQYHVTFCTNSRPHIMCAALLKVNNITPIPQKRGTTVQTAFFTVGGLKNKYCRYHGTIYAGITAMMVGTVGSWGSPGDPPGPYDGQQYVMFMEWTKNGWVLKGDGIVAGIAVSWLTKRPRSHFTMGRGAQKVLDKWPCDGGNPGVTTKRLPMSYGVLPLKNYGVKASDIPKRKIHWFGLKGDDPPSESWYEFNFWNGTLPPKKEMNSYHALWLVACSSPDPPNYIDVESTSRLRGFVYLPMEWTDVSLGRASLNVLQKALAKGIMGVNGYLVAVRFTKYVIYLKSVPDKTQKTPFTNTAVSPYLVKLKQVRVLNGDYVVTKEERQQYEDLDRELELLQRQPYIPPRPQPQVYFPPPPLPPPPPQPLNFTQPSCIPRCWRRRW